MEHQVMQTILNYIDNHITERLSAESLAQIAGYSTFHFSRMFSDTLSISPMAYVTWRKLQYALYDISKGAKIIDVAMEYGFETHAGFTKAFKRVFRFPPSLCYLYLNPKPPTKVTVDFIKNKFQGGNMTPHIMEVTPFAVVGYPTRHKVPGVRTTADIPTFWDTIKLDYSPILTKLYETFPNSKHCEISMCYDVDESNGEFTYMMGRGIDVPADLANIEPDMTRVDIAGGLYAIFSTPPVDPSTVGISRDSWNEIFLHWLPESEFEFDESRTAFEYEDFRSHGHFFGGNLQMDLYVPICKRNEEGI